MTNQWTDGVPTTSGRYWFYNRVEDDYFSGGVDGKGKLYDGYGNDLYLQYITAYMPLTPYATKEEETNGD